MINDYRVATAFVGIVSVVGPNLQGNANLCTALRGTQLLAFAQVQNLNLDVIAETLLPRLIAQV